MLCEGLSPFHTKCSTRNHQCRNHPGSHSWPDQEGNGSSVQRASFYTGKRLNPVFINWWRRREVMENGKQLKESRLLGARVGGRREWGKTANRHRFIWGGWVKIGAIVTQLFIKTNWIVHLTCMNCTQSRREKSINWAKNKTKTKKQLIFFADAWKPGIEYESHCILFFFL